MGDGPFSHGLAAIKLTALGRPQLLVRSREGFCTLLKNMSLARVFPSKFHFLDFVDPQTYSYLRTVSLSFSSIILVATQRSYHADEKILQPNFRGRRKCHESSREERRVYKEDRRG